MGPFATREVILLPFPFSDLSASKLRPALLLANAGKGDWVLCQITSKPYADARAITLTEADFAQGGLRLTSYARAGKLFTAHESLFQRVAGTLQAAAHQHVVEQVVSPCCVKKRQGQKLGGLGELKTRFRRKCSSRLRWPSTQLCPGFAGNWGADTVERQRQYAWGQGFVAQLSADLMREFPEVKGFSASNLKYIRQWHLFWSAVPIGQQPVDQLSPIPWGYNQAILAKCKPPSSTLLPSPCARA